MPLCVQDSSHTKVYGSEEALPHSFLGRVWRQLDREEARVTNLDTCDTEGNGSGGVTMHSSKGSGQHRCR